MEDGHVLFVAIQSFQPVRQLMLGQIDFEGLFLLVFFLFFRRKRRQPELAGQISVGLANKNEATRLASRRWTRPMRGNGWQRHGTGCGK